MKKILLAIVLFATSLNINAQEGIEVGIYQDLKFATIGDKERGYDAFTTDVLFRFKMQGNQQKLGYMIIYPEYEYAAIEGDYHRYSANVGYCLNKLILNNFEVEGALSYGFIDRYGKSLSSFGANLGINYKMGDFKLSAITQFTERKDLTWLWGTKNNIKYSFFVGISYKIK